MPWIIALAFTAIVALIVSFAAHFLFSPWLLVRLPPGLIRHPASSGLARAR
jgi:hypothetical protein